MTLMTPIKPGLVGAAPGLAAVTASDTVQNNGQMLLHVHNGSGGSINVTIKDRGSRSPAAAAVFTPDVVEPVGAGADAYFGPFPPSRFNDSAGIMTIQYSATATVTAEIVDVST